MSEPVAVPNPANLAFVEQLYVSYLRDPASVPEVWRAYFDGFPVGDRFGRVSRLGPTFRRRSIFNPRGSDGRATPGVGPEVALGQDRVDQLVRAYRVRGHIMAQFDPLHHPKPYRPELKISYYGFSRADMDRPFSSRTIHGAATRTLREILFLLRDTYCRSIGVQFMHIDQFEARQWLQERMEATRNRLSLERAEQLRILTRLTDAVIFEDFIQKKYVGAKRFSLEGGESLIPLLDLALERAGAQGIEEVVIGMAHRGRLNVLANIIGKSPRDIFREFEDADADLTHGPGDVKYHLGFHGDWETAAERKIHVALCFNPSHLEFVNPVALGRVRAKQDRAGDLEREQVLAVLIHGDAAFAGEGVVQETLNLSGLTGYRTGGTLHVVVNNQLGFTTTPAEGRSASYATDVAKMLQSPIFHVNGEDPEAVAQVVRLAMDFRRAFKRDVVIDMYCYRRYGHNESDEPSFTQPTLYRKIQARPSVREGYLRRLLEMGEITPTEADEIAARRRADLERDLAGMRTEGPSVGFRPSVLGRLWSRYQGGPESSVADLDTAVEREHLVELLEAQTQLPAGFHLHPKLGRLVEARRRMARGEQRLDWAAAESLAFASLLTDGTRVRLSGQDSGRGTFSNRHAILHDHENDHPYVPLQHLAPDQAPFEAFNSPLSESGVLGFEYGYSIAYPDGLVVWEAQFGDFLNVAQVYLDQFLASAEIKWHSLSGLVLLLPHGMEGQGPEHSSARPERLLELAANDNIQVVNPTTPAQYFHVLRRQVLRPWRKPLFVLTPKSLLRHPAATSSLGDLAQGRFERVIGDSAVTAEQVRRVLLCSGKLVYELERVREERGIMDVAILRVEQLYPLPDQVLQDALGSFADGTPVVFVQEEPANMGAAPHLRVRFGSELYGRWPFAVLSRPASASPASGSAKQHRLEQAALVERALGVVGSSNF